MFVKIMLENIEYDVFYSEINLKQNIKFHKPLCIALWSKITPKQKTDIIIINPYNNKQLIVNFDMLLNCFKCTKQYTMEYFNVKSKVFNDCNFIETDELRKYNFFDNSKLKCACGIRICNEHVIKNISNEYYYIIGSDCIKWWKYDKSVINLMEITKAIENKKDIPKFCSFCGREANCKNCSQKQCMRNVIQKWRIHSNIKLRHLFDNLNSNVNFGKYCNKPYHILCKDYKYIHYILSNNFKESIKSILKGYIRYEHILLKDLYKNKLIINY